MLNIERKFIVIEKKMLFCIFGRKQENDIELKLEITIHCFFTAKVFFI